MLSKQKEPTFRFLFTSRVWEGTAAEERVKREHPGASGPMKPSRADAVM